jgi:hypothetical protein
VELAHEEDVAAWGRLTRLRREEYWYFFRVLAFGSANPYDQHPDLASIGNGD